MITETIQLWNWRVTMQADADGAPLTRTLEVDVMLPLPAADPAGNQLALVAKTIQLPMGMPAAERLSKALVGEVLGPEVKVAKRMPKL